MITPLSSTARPSGSLPSTPTPTTIADVPTATRAKMIALSRILKRPSSQSQNRACGQETWRRPLRSCIVFTARRRLASRSDVTSPLSPELPVKMLQLLDRRGGAVDRERHSRAEHGSDDLGELPVKTLQLLDRQRAAVDLRATAATSVGSLLSRAGMVRAWSTLSRCTTAQQRPLGSNAYGTAPVGGVL